MKNETSEESLELKQAYQKGYADAMSWKTANHLEHLPAAQQQHNLKLMPREATREMLEAMDECSMEGYDERLYAGHAASVYMAAWDVAPTLPKRKQEFIKHEVKNADDWSEWVCPDPKGYLMKCCDCGLVHEAEFGVVRYKSETEREECEMLDEPNLQAVFRMRRSEPWSSEDTAHRAGGLPMEQPKKEPVAWRAPNWGHGDDEWVYRDFDDPVLIADGKPSPNNEPLYTTPPQRKPLTDEQVREIAKQYALGLAFPYDSQTTPEMFARAIEAAHGIKE